MGPFIEPVIIAALVSLGLIVGIAAMVRGFIISRRPSHHLATRPGNSPVPSEVDSRPPWRVGAVRRAQRGWRSARGGSGVNSRARIAHQHHRRPILAAEAGLKHVVAETQMSWPPVPHD
jgi:hypothetical protein